ncbi:hypothetical protein AVMA1855_09345 [Acidovorax sp. SUPP1855]|uniref:hypothetical protein n=1 Tax=Acidovorax sp. SUPP1855 TaxID=431774 RepID=UPI0023DE4EFF|nr:hypothetical protein [Acidovorax sp. SUPP1855]GKS84343.1 hypothetical protein AVMA1855_09345 [Acidovorax sp. SUPP1855]
MVLAAGARTPVKAARHLQSGKDAVHSFERMHSSQKKAWLREHARWLAKNDPSDGESGSRPTMKPVGGLPGLAVDSEKKSPKALVND